MTSTGPACASTNCSSSSSRCPSATAIRFISAERPYEDSLTLEQARLPDAMLAYELDGHRLSRPHGAPARLSCRRCTATRASSG